MTKDDMPQTLYVSLFKGQLNIDYAGTADNKSVLYRRADTIPDFDFQFALDAVERLDIGLIGKPMYIGVMEDIYEIKTALAHCAKIKEVK